MHQTTINGRDVSFYESIKALPAGQYQKAKAYEILDAELPGSEADIEAGLLKLKQFQRAGQQDSFDQLLNNLLLGRQLILTQYQPKQLEWATYIYSVGGERVTDFSENHLEALIVALNPAQGDIEAILELVKKLSAELKRYYPARIGQAGRSRNHAERDRAYYLALLAHAATPTEETARAVEARMADILHHQKPLCFESGANDVLTQLEKSYYKLTHAMAECGCPNPTELTVFEFYAWEESLQDKYKPLENDARKRQ